MTRKEELRTAIRCCRESEGCEECPLQEEICDELYVGMVEIPETLLDLIDEALGTDEEHRTVSQNLQTMRKEV